MAPHYVPLNDDGYQGSLQYVPPQLLCLPHDEEDMVRELSLNKGMTGLVGRLFSGTHEKRQDKKIYPHPCSILGPPLIWAIFLDPSLIISLPHLLSISNETIIFLRSVKQIIFPPTWIKESLMVS